MSKVKFPQKDDQQIGARIRSRRLQLEMSQEKLADKIGLTFQQVQKYEKGVNRVSGSRMIQIAQALDVEPSYFFGQVPGTGQGDDADFIEFATSRQGVELVALWAHLSATQRVALIQTARAFATTG